MPTPLTDADKVIRNDTGKEIAAAIRDLAAPEANKVAYDNTSSGLTADNAQDAIDELKTKNDTKMNKANPTGTGSLSIGRKAETQTGSQSVAVGYNVEASGARAVALGHATKATGDNGSFAEGYGSTASGNYASHAEGRLCTASGTDGAHAEGYESIASAAGSHSEGRETQATANYAHAEGYKCIASGQRSHAEGTDTTASGSYSHAEGRETKSTVNQAHAEGYQTEASGNSSHAENYGTKASGAFSHAEGSFTVANHKAQHAFGEYNVEDASSATSSNRGNYVEIVGNGVDDANRSNARTLDWSGNETLAGNLTYNGDVSLSRLLNAYSFSSASALNINVGRYCSIIILGFAQGIGGVAILLIVTGSSLVSIIDMITGAAWSNAHLTFSLSNNVLTVTSDSTSISNLTVIYGGN